MRAIDVCIKLRREDEVVLISESAPCDIQPEKIATDQHFWCAFGNYETEVSARWIIRFFKENDLPWRPFAYEEIDAFYRQKLNKPDAQFTFNRLLESTRWIAKHGDQYVLSHDFVHRCYQAALEASEEQARMGIRPIRPVKGNGMHGIGEHIRQFSNRSNRLRTPRFAQPLALRAGDVLATGDRVLSHSQEDADGLVSLHLSNGSGDRWVNVHVRIPIALLAQEDETRASAAVWEKSR